MKIIDVTRPLKNDMLVYPGDLIPSFSQVDHGRYLISDLHLIPIPVLISMHLCIISNRVIPSMQSPSLA